MLKKQCITFGATALVIFAGLVACAAPPYQPSALTPRPAASPMAAVAKLAATLEQHGWRDHLQMVWPDGQTRVCRFRDTADPQVLETVAFSNSILTLKVNCDNGKAWEWSWREEKERGPIMSTATGKLAADMATLWYQLSLVPAEAAGTFEAQAQAYRAVAKKPELPEPAREFKVRAEAAVKEKRFLDAVEAYDRALQLAPWWPQGHFNAALVLGELKTYGLATEEMQRYLALVPDATNARQAQDQIYAWRGKLEKPL